MPNSKAKDRKRKKRNLNERWKKEGRTAIQKDNGPQFPVYGRAR